MIFSNEHSKDNEANCNQILADAARNVALNRVNQISQESEKEKGIDVLMSAIKNGCDEFSKDDVENFRQGRKGLIDAPHAIYIEAYLRAIEKVSKDLNNALQSDCAQIISSFPYRLR